MQPHHPNTCFTIGKLSNLILSLFFLLISCDNNRVFEAMVDIDKFGWKENRELKFDFEIDNSGENYSLYYNVRYNNTYQNYNLYVKHFILDSNGRQLNSLLQGMDLFRPTTGEPYGSGIGGTFDYRILSLKNHKFPYKGRYTLLVKQYMRQPDLKGIEAFGIRIERQEKN